MDKITRREFLRRFLGRDGERKKESISEENKETKGIKRREFLKGLIAFLIGLFLLREEKKVEKERENKWQSPGEEYIKSKIEEIFKDVDGPETLGEFYEEHQFYEELLKVPIEEKKRFKSG